MRREGSPFQGLGTVVLKELADHLVAAPACACWNC